MVDDYGDPLPTYHLEQQLCSCIEMADQIPSTRPKLGVLTALDRDSWAKSRGLLIEIGGEKMKEALETLQSGCVMLNLDNDTPRSLEDCSWQFISGGEGSMCNPWFDKSINLMVTPNGKAGVLFEHSMMDGTVTLGYADRVAQVTSTIISDKKKG